MGNLSRFVHHPHIYERYRDSRLALDCISLFFRPVAHMRLELIGRGLGTALRQPPPLVKMNTVSGELSNHRRRWGSSPDEKSHRRYLSAAPMVFPMVEHCSPLIR